VAFRVDGNTLASGSSDNSIKLWDVGTGKTIATLEGHTGAVLSLTFNPDGMLLASTSADHTIKLWDLAAGK
jgi:WD40 repeat protein